jgi:hypothetical protein
MKKFLLTFYCLFLLSTVSIAEEIQCNFLVDKIIKSKSGKFVKDKIYNDEKEFNIKITNLVNQGNNRFKGILNGANHTNRNVEIHQTTDFIEIMQSDAYSTPYRSIYTIFTKEPSSKGGFLSSMYTNFQSNWGFAQVRYYRGNCLIR